MICPFQVSSSMTFSKFIDLCHHDHNQFQIIFTRPKRPYLFSYSLSSVLRHLRSGSFGSGGLLVSGIWLPAPIPGVSSLSRFLVSLSGSLFLHGSDPLPPRSPHLCLFHHTPDILSLRWAILLGPLCSSSSCSISQHCWDIKNVTASLVGAGELASLPNSLSFPCPSLPVAPTHCWP